MPRLNWNQPGSRVFESGVDRGVLFPSSGPGVAWPGITSVAESSSGAEQKPYYIDGVMCRNRIGSEEFSATLSAYSFPIEFLEYDGNSHNNDGLIFTLQPRRPFGMSYRTGIGSDLLEINKAYKINIIYNVLAGASQKTYASLGGQNTPIQYSWPLSARPIIFTNLKPTPHLVIDSTRADPDKLAELEDVIYGTESTDSRLPFPDEIISILSA